VRQSHDELGDRPGHGRRKEMNGVTVLTRNPDGLVEHVCIHHRPLDAVMEFSRELGRRLAGVVPTGSFAD
jgi:hypothetical protein